MLWTQNVSNRNYIELYELGLGFPRALSDFIGSRNLIHKTDQIYEET